MNKIQKLIVSMKVVIHLWKMGFYFSDNSHKVPTKSSLGEYWGFYRLNHDDGITKPTYAIFDIDFAEKINDEKSRYFHMHSDTTLLRKDYHEVK